MAFLTETTLRVTVEIPHAEVGELEMLLRIDRISAVSDHWEHRGVIVIDGCILSVIEDFHKVKRAFLDHQKIRVLAGEG